MTPDINTIVNLGIGGFAIWILYLQSKKTADSQDKIMSRMKEKDQELISEIDKRDRRNEDQQKSFNNHITKVHESTTAQLSENTKALTGAAIALEQNLKVMESVNNHLQAPHPVFIQNNADGKK